VKAPIRRMLDHPHTFDVWWWWYCFLLCNRRFRMYMNIVAFRVWTQTSFSSEPISMTQNRSMKIKSKYNRKQNKFKKFTSIPHASVALSSTITEIKWF
jgi:hypothetical protein